MTIQKWLQGLMIISISLFGVLLLVFVCWYQLKIIHDEPKPIVGRDLRHHRDKKHAIIPRTVPDYTLPPVVGGIPPLITNIPTKQPVVFLGIDDGAYKDPSVIKIIKDNHIKASLYIAKFFTANNPAFFKEIVKTGSLVENHTLSHDLHMTRTMTYEQQKAEICGMADYEQQVYGRRPIFFRPPGGAYSASLMRAAGACGMRAVVNWIALAGGGVMQYQIGDKLRPGDVVLMHFRPEFLKDMQAFIDAQNAAGLHTELLEDWVG